MPPIRRRQRYELEEAEKKNPYAFKITFRFIFLVLVTLGFIGLLIYVFTRDLGGN